VANTQGIRAGRAYVELGVNDKISAGLRAAQRRLQAFGAALAGAGVAILTPMIGAAKVFADFGSELNDMAGRTGMAVEALSELGYAADMTGTDLATVEVGVRRMQKTLSAARDGSKEASDALAKLGISAAKIATLAPEQQFEAIAQSLRGISDPTERAAAAMSVFGKGGTALLPMVADLDALRKKARALGLTMTTEQASAADELGDSYLHNAGCTLRFVIQFVQFRIPFHAIHELARLDLIRCPPKQECLDRVIAHEAVKKALHLFLSPHKGTLNMG